MFAPAAPISLQESQVQQLRVLARAGTTTQRVARRCRVILLAHEGTSNSAIAEQLGLSRPTHTHRISPGRYRSNPAGPETETFSPRSEQGVGAADSRYDAKD